MAEQNIDIAVRAKNQTGAALGQVRAEIAGVAQEVQRTASTFASVGAATRGLTEAGAGVRALSAEMQRAVTEAEQYHRALSEPARVQNAGGLESVSLTIKALRSEVAGLSKEAAQLNRGGAFNFGEGAAANAARITGALGKLQNELNTLSATARAAAKAGVLGDGSAPSAQLVEIGQAVTRLRGELKATGQQATDTAKRVSSVGGASAGGGLGGLGSLRAQIQQMDQAVGGMLGMGGMGMLGGALGIGATVMAVQAMTGAVNDMVMEADRLDKLRGSFDDLARGAGQSSEQMLAVMRAASNGMIGDADLILSANKAMLLGVADSGEELAALLQVAQARGKAMGLSATQAFNDIVTGLGRESALILDNLGITIDITTVMNDYARSLGVAADQLDATQRKQALLNEVMRQSANMKPALPSGPGAAAAQAAVAQEQARAAAGEFFSGPSREWAQMQADALNMLMGKYSEFAVAVREVNDALADQESGKTNMPEEYANRLRMWAEGMALVSTAAATGLPEAEAYLDTLEKMSVRGLSSGFTEQDINVMQLATSSIREAQAERERAGAAASAAAAHYIEEATAQQHAAQAAYEASAAYAENVRQHEAIVASAWRATAEMQAMASQFGIVGVMALQAATDIATFNAAVGRIQAGFAVADRLQGMRQSAIAAANSAAQRAVNEGADPNQVAAMLANVTDQIWNMAGPTDQTTESMFLFQQQLHAGGAELEDYADGLAEANRASQKLAAGGISAAGAAAKAAGQEYENLKNKVAGVLQQGLNVGVGVEAKDLLPREKEINENARRLADIAVNGLKDQEWLNDFKREVPQVWFEILETLESGGDVKQKAAQILRDFEDGLRPDVLDRGVAKERVKRMLIGEQSMANLATEIANELAAEMNVPLEQAMAAASKSLGVSASATPGGAEGAGQTGAATVAVVPDVSAFANMALPPLSPVALPVTIDVATVDMTALNQSGAAAGTQWGAGFVANASGVLLTASIVMQMAGELPRFRASGAAAGTQWGAGFMGAVESGIGAPLIYLLARLVTPDVLAYFRAQTSRTGALP